MLFPVIRISAGTAACMGLKEIRAQVKPTTAYLLWGEHCLMGCTFCPQSRESLRLPDRLGRVNWPPFSLAELSRGFQKGEAGGLKRVCLQGVRGREGTAPLLEILGRIREATDLPVCVSAWIDHGDEAARLLEGGAERVSIALDAATPRVYRQVKGGSFRERHALLLECARRWPGRVGTHIILGLGETEEEALCLMDSLYREGVTVALFAFTPLKGTPLAGKEPPEPPSYRRVQAASYLLQEGRLALSRLTFRQGRILSFGLSPGELREALAGGKAFETRGCPHCNRPFYNERPGGFLYNYPRPLTEAEEREAVDLVLKAAEEGGAFHEGNLAPGT